jgi:hypothetical protein
MMCLKNRKYYADGIIFKFSRENAPLIVNLGRKGAQQSVNFVNVG